MGSKITIERRPLNHLVYFYSQNGWSLARHAGGYLAEGLKRGAAAMAIVTDAHRAAFCEVLESQSVDVAHAVEQRQLLWCHADETLRCIMKGGQPDWRLFKRTIERSLAKLAAAQGNGVRVYGEMVDLLWNAGHSQAAALVEEFWNRLIRQHALTLFCAYQVDRFGPEFQAPVLDTVLRAHSHVIPDAENGCLDGAVNRALDEVLGTSTADSVRRRMQTDFNPAWAEIPPGESMLFWLHTHLPDRAAAILMRARTYYHPGSLGLGASSPIA